MTIPVAIPVEVQDANIVSDNENPTAASVPITNIVFSFDTTGSMSGALGSIRREITNTINNMFAKVPNISIGIIAHGDYGDERRSYLIKSIDITNDKEALINFVNNTGSSGGNWYAAYDKVLHDVQMFSWTSTVSRSLVMIGDSIPREKGHNTHGYCTSLDWRKETEELAAMGINIYSVQCFDTRDPVPRTFYKYMSNKTNGYHLYLDQFSEIKDILTAICYKQIGDDNLTMHENDFQRPQTSTLSGLTKNMRAVIDILLKKTTTENVEEENNNLYDYSSFTGRGSSSTTRTRKTIDFSNIKPEDIVIKPSAPSRFQILNVDIKISMKELAAQNMLTFKSGKGFYQFTKPEKISKIKEIILLDLRDGLLYEGLGCRQMLNLLNYDPEVKIKPSSWSHYTVFVQSTSQTRNLEPDTKFVYDISQ